MVNVEDPANHVRALRIVTHDAGDRGYPDRVCAALERRWPHDRDTTVKVAVLLVTGHSLEKAREMLKLTEDEVRAADLRLKRIAREMEREAA